MANSDLLATSSVLFLFHSLSKSVQGRTGPALPSVASMDMLDI